MKKLIPLTALIVGLSLVGTASAGNRWHQKNHSYEDTARVLKVKPIYDTVRVSIPEQRCWKERVHSRRSNRESYTGPLLGAIIGGAVGNRFGSGDGKTAMTVAGSLLGASIGNDIYQDDHYAGRRHRVERRCETVDHYETREEVVGYRVKYKYKGRVYRTRMDHRPGDTIRVKVNVRPIH